MKIRALRNYTDNVLRKEIKKGDEYEVSNERGKQILSHPKNLAILIEIVKEEVKEIIEKPIEDKEVVKMVGDITTVEQKVDNIIVETDDIKVVIENKEDKPKTTAKKKVTKKK